LPAPKGAGFFLPFFGSQGLVIFSVKTFAGFDKVLFCANFVVVEGFNKLGRYKND